MTGRVSLRGLRAFALSLGLALGLSLGAGVTDAADEVIDFDKAPAGADAAELFVGRGVTLSTHPTIFATPQARSGRHALWNLGPDSTTPSEQLIIEFAEDLDIRRVVVYVGLQRAAGGEQVRVTVDAVALVQGAEAAPGSGLAALRLPSVFDAQTRTLTAGDTGATPIDARFELARASGESPILVVRITSAPPRRVIAVDDLSFEARSPRPRAQPTPTQAPRGRP